MKFIHQNFEIDEKVDKEIASCFDQMVEFQLSKLQNDTTLSEDMKIQMAVEMVYVKKEELKLKRKRKAAEELNKTSIKRQRIERNPERGSRLMRWCLRRQLRKHLEGIKVEFLEELISEESDKDELDEF